MQEQIQNTILSALRAQPLFADCADDVLRAVLSGCRVEDCQPGGIPGGGCPSPCLTILTEGGATVHSVSGGGDFVLRTLRPGDMTGAASLFAVSDAAQTVTHVIADKPTRVVCVSEDAIRSLISTDPAFALRYIAFLTGRIRFLNRRLSCLTAGSAAARLAAWLDTTAPEGASAFDLPVPMSRLCDALDIGRASLYRAEEELTAQGFLVRDGRRITLPDRAGMCRAYALG